MSGIEVAEAVAADHAAAARVRCFLVADARRIPVDELDDEFVAANAAFIEAGLAAGTYRAWLARTGAGEVIGGIALALVTQPPLPDEPRTAEGWIIATWVQPDHRSLGIGRRLMVALEDAARTAGVRRLFLFATDDGRPLYDSSGFAPRDDLLLKHL